MIFTETFRRNYGINNPVGCLGFGHKYEIVVQPGLHYTGKVEIFHFVRATVILKIVTYFDDLIANSD